MTIDVARDRIPMSQRERDCSNYGAILEGKRTQAEQLGLPGAVRHVRGCSGSLRMVRWCAGARLRGKPSNRRLDATLRQQVLDTYRQRFVRFRSDVRV